MTPLLRKILGMNWVLVFTMYGLLIFGVFSIESAARHIPIDDVPPEAWGTVFADKQQMWIVIGSLIYFATALIDYRWLKWLGIPMYGVGIALLILLLAQGSETHRLDLGPIPFQPTQVAIASGIIMIGLCLESLPRLHRFFAQPFVKLAIIGVLCGVP